jgi:hypothetical protein
MYSGEIILFGVPIITAIAAGCLAYALGRGRAKSGTILLAGAIVAFALWMYVGLEMTPGWDAVIYLLGLLGIALPAALGTVLGGLIGWKQKKDQTYA